MRYTVFMLNLSSVMIGTMQPEVMAEFYESVFEKSADMVEGSWHGWSLGTAFFSVGEHSEMDGKAKDAGRVMFNLESEDVQGDFDRIKDIEGVQIVKEPYEMGAGLIATLADPDGNYFQLMSPWESEENLTN